MVYKLNFVLLFVPNCSSSVINKIIRLKFLNALNLEKFSPKSNNNKNKPFL